MTTRLVLTLVAFGLVACAEAPMQTASQATDILSEPYPEEQVKVKGLLEDISDAVRRKDLDRLESYHLYGPKFTKFGPNDHLDRQDAAAARADERGMSSLKAIHPTLSDVRVDVFGA